MEDRAYFELREKLAESNMKLYLEIIGDGPEREYVKKKLSNLKEVIWHGHPHKPKVRPSFYGHRIASFSSRQCFT